MLSRSILFRLIGHLVLFAFALVAGTLPQNTPAAPAPKPKSPFALLYISKRSSQYKTIRYRGEQIDLIKTRSSPFVLFWAIDSLKNTDLPSLPKKGKGGENGNDHKEDETWLEQNLKVEYLDGTGVLRISLRVGNPGEQAVLANAVAQAYLRAVVRPWQEQYEKNLEALRRVLSKSKMKAAASKGEAKETAEQVVIEVEDGIKRVEEELRTLPRVLELADVPPK